MEISTKNSLKLTLFYGISMAFSYWVLRIGVSWLGFRGWCVGIGVLDEGLGVGGLIGWLVVPMYAHLRLNLLVYFV